MSITAYIIPPLFSSISIFSSVVGNTIISKSSNSIIVLLLWPKTLPMLTQQQSIEKKSKQISLIKIAVFHLFFNLWRHVNFMLTMGLVSNLHKVQSLTGNSSSCRRRLPCHWTWWLDTFGLQNLHIKAKQCALTLNKESLAVHFSKPMSAKNVAKNHKNSWLICAFNSSTSIL